jgi:adenylate cyclase
LSKKTAGIKNIIVSTLAPEKTTQLPQRVTQAISKQEDSSEILVKFIQLFVVTIFGILYLVSPKTDANTQFSPVPYAILSYLAINLIMLLWALKRSLPNLVVYASIIIDTALLMILIWSFHIQYEQPPSFYLKAPTLLYIFIFIALRALRFQARFVVAAGFAAAIGWSMMILYVIKVDPANSMITRNYIEYMTSNSILLGAEFDKIISMLIVTGILALALNRAHNLLVSAVTEQTAAQDLSRFFDDTVALKIRDADHQIAPGEGINRQASVLNIDIRGFTKMAAKMDAGDVMGILTEYQKRMVPLIQKHGGTIDKFMGDGIMATFGATNPCETFAADSIKAMDDIVADLNTWTTNPELVNLAPLTVNMAVATGPITFGAVGDDHRLEYTVIGAAVNLSAKLEKFNKALNSSAIVDKASYDLARAQGYSPLSEPQIAAHNVEGTDEKYELCILY